MLHKCLVVIGMPLWLIAVGTFMAAGLAAVPLAIADVSNVVAGAYSRSGYQDMNDIMSAAGQERNRRAYGNFEKEDFNKRMHLLDPDGDGVAESSGRQFTKNIGGAAGEQLGVCVGAIWGASIGSVVPVVGTAIGGIVGGILGYINGKYAGEAGTRLIANFLGIGSEQKVTDINANYNRYQRQQAAIMPATTTTGPSVPGQKRTPRRKPGQFTVPTGN